MLLTLMCRYILPTLLIGHSCSGAIVYPKLLESRADGASPMLHVHAGLTITLEKSSILANPLHFVSLSPEDSNTAVLNGQDLDKNLYHDAARRSSLTLEHSPGGVIVHGILSGQYRIAPLVSSRSGSGDIAHSMEEIDNATAANSSEDSEEVPGTLNCVEDILGNITVKRQSVQVFNVELCFVVSKNYTAAFNSSVDLLKYIGIMTNWAALPYTDMVCPKIQLQVNKIIEVPDEFLFTEKTCNITKDILMHDSNTYICGYDAEETLNNTVGYINTCVRESCDIVYHLTSEELIHVRSGNFIPEVEGLTTTAGVCTSDRFAIGEDLPNTYSGRVTLAHEIGHLLGCDHDGCPTALNCPHHYGNLMSHVHVDMQNKSKLSSCCMDRIRELVRKLPESCLDVNKTANFTNYFYPGENVTYEDFCELMHPGIDVVPSYKNYAQQCQIKCCWNETLPNSTYSGEEEVFTVEEYSTSTEESAVDDGDYDGYENFCEPHDMLDGMRCDENKTCYRGYCGTHNWTEIRLKYHTVRTFA